MHGIMTAAGKISTSDSLETNDMWKKTIGYDPYKAEGEGDDATTMQESGEINQSAKGLFQLARLTGNTSTYMPGACKKCGQTGHLFFQCRNWMTNTKKLSDKKAEEDESDDPDSDPDVAEASSDDDDDDASEGQDSESSPSVKKKKKKKGKKDKKKSKKDKKKVKKKDKKKKK